MYLAVLDEGNARSLLMYHQVKALWNDAELIDMRAHRDAASALQSVAMAKGSFDAGLEDIGVLLMTPRGPVAGDLLERVADLVVPPWEREWAHQISLGFCDALIITPEIPMDKDPQIKVNSNLLTLSVNEQTPHPLVTTFFLGSAARFITSGCAALDQVYRIDPNPEGIYAAHLQICELCPTVAFCIIDEDSKVLAMPKFPPVIRHNLIYECRNPYNGLVYGHGGIKVFLRSAFLARPPVPVHEDMTLWVSKDCGLEVMDGVCSEHHFATSPYEGFRAAFREAYKLAHTDTPEARKRLRRWCNTKRYNKPYWIALGAQVGKDFAERSKNFPINNFAEIEKVFLHLVNSRQEYSDGDSSE